MSLRGLRSHTLPYFGALALLVMPLAACDTTEAPPAELEQQTEAPFVDPEREPSGGGQATTGNQPVDPAVGLGVDDACSDTDECRYGLVCDKGVCRAIANTPATGFCFLTEECAEGLYCSDDGICLASGEGALGDVCATASECARGLHCQTLGLMGSCQESGSGDVGMACQTTGDCLAGLYCNQELTCQAWYGGAATSVWSGLLCEDEDEGEARPYFELSGESGEFFRMPFPSDVFRGSGTVAPAGFPLPGRGVVGFDPIERLLEASSATQRGFSLTPTIYFRFSATMNFQSISGAANGTIEAPTLHFVNVDPESPGYGGGPSYNWHVTDGAGSKVICPRWLAVQVGYDEPLEPNTTYAVYLTQGVRTPSGEMMSADDDFVAMLGESAPEGEPAGAAWATFEPLRAYLTDKGIPAEELLSGTVFTTQAPRAEMQTLRASLFAPAAPEVQSLALCSGEGQGACAGRACIEAGEGVQVLQLELDLPRVQQGLRPFLEAGDGGGLTMSEGSVQLHGEDSVCASLSLPTAEMPQAGWPLVLFAHGGGADANQAMEGVAALLAEVGVAVLSWDGPMHGARGDAAFWPEALVYNLRNPKGMMGTLYQGAADIFALVRAAKAWALADSESPTGAEIRFDAEHIALMGHGLGASIGAIAAPHEPGIGLTVWSSASAAHAQMMLSRLAPVDVPYNIALLLHEYGIGGAEELDPRHPVLSFYQAYFEPVDPVTHLSAQGAPGGDGAPQHVLQIQGIGDRYAPSRVSDVFARLTDGELASPILREIDGVDNVAPPITNNVGSEEVPRTSVIIQSLPPDDQSGAPRWPAAEAWREDSGVRAQLQAFVQSWIVDGVPTLPLRSGE